MTVNSALQLMSLNIKISINSNIMIYYRSYWLNKIRSLATIETIA